MPGTRFRDREDFEQTVDAAAGILFINPAIIEKDYWVSQALRAIAGEFPNDFVFKGGTSLSKGFRILERFSEDVDILILPGSRGTGARDTLMKGIGKSGGVACGDEDPARRDSSEGVHRTFEIRYPRHRSADWLRPTIRLEMGVRGGPEPHDQRDVGTMVGDVLLERGIDPAEFDDLVPFPVPILHPARTLVEKLALVNELARQLVAEPKEGFPPQGRHFYDIYQLLGTPMIIEFLKDRATFESVVADCETVSREHFKSDYRRPVGGYADGEAFTSSGEIRKALGGAHEDAKEMYFGQGPYPSFDDVVARVQQRRDLL